MRKIIAALLSTAMSVLFSFAAVAHESATEMDHWHGWHDHNYGFWWIFPLMLMFFFFLFLFRGRGGRSKSWWSDPDRWRSFTSGEGNPSEAALDILDRRYAQWEIDKEEYEEKERRSFRRMRG